MIKKIVPAPIIDFAKNLKKPIQFILWVNNGRKAPPPPFVKVKIIKKHSKNFNLKIFIETGTCYGDTVNEVKSLFKELFSIELDKKLYEASKNRFRNYPTIKIFNGDSSDHLAKILPQIKEPILFWLDAHYSGGVTARGRKETPIVEELKTIFDYYIDGSIILIDDARCFLGKDDYPSIEEIKNFIGKFNPKLRLKIEDDIIIISPVFKSFGF